MVLAFPYRIVRLSVVATTSTGFVIVNLCIFQPQTTGFVIVNLCLFVHTYVENQMLGYGIGLAVCLDLHMHDSKVTHLFLHSTHVFTTMI
jgi:hypothetical protein